jgi:very-short-patch-repair endonuclease
VRCCVVCGDTLSGRGKRLYCEAHRLEDRECKSCGASFRVDRKRKDRNFVCSLSCRKPREWGRQKVDRQCAHCGVGFEAYPSVIEGGRAKFCSRSCAGLARPISGRPSKIADDAIDTFLASSPMLCEREKRMGRWSVDLALPLHSIAVELDGEYWHSLPAMVDRDRRKDAWLMSQGWTVVRIVIAKSDTPESVARRIAEELDLCLSSAA